MLMNVGLITVSSFSVDIGFVDRLQYFPLCVCVCVCVCVCARELDRKGGILIKMDQSPEQITVLCALTVVS